MADERAELKQLEILRTFPGWSLELDVLAVKSVAIGRLGEADQRANERLGLGLRSSSNSRVPFAPQLVPESADGRLPTRVGLFHEYLRVERQRALCLPITLDTQDD